MNKQDAKELGTKVGTAIAKGSKATGRGLVFGIAYTGVHSKKIGKSFWAGMKAAGKAIADEYKELDK